MEHLQLDGPPGRGAIYGEGELFVQDGDLRGAVEVGTVLGQSSRELPVRGFHMAGVRTTQGQEADS